MFLVVNDATVKIIMITIKAGAPRNRLNGLVILNFDCFIFLGSTLISCYRMRGNTSQVARPANRIPSELKIARS